MAELFSDASEREQLCELLLYLFGRRSVAQVDVTGPADAVEALQRTQVGM